MNRKKNANASTKTTKAANATTKRDAPTDSLPKRVRTESPPTREQRDVLRAFLLENLSTLSLPDAVRLMRHALGKTQSDYAKMVGVTQTTLTLIETGKSNPSVRLLEAISKPFGLELGFRVPASRRGE